MTTPIPSAQFWARYPTSYRAAEMARLAGWITAGESGVVVGPAGVGRSTLLNFLCHRPDTLRRYLTTTVGPIVLIPVDLNNLPDNRLVTLYRVILRAFYEIGDRFDPALQPEITALYRKTEAARDPFLPQSALRELLLRFQAEATRIVLVMNRFDVFCQTATPQMTNTLRGLRDSFRNTLAFIMGMRHEVTYLSDLESIGPVRGILDTHICRVGPLNETDARDMIGRETGYLPTPLPETAVNLLLTLTGRFPGLIRVLCQEQWGVATEGSQAESVEAWLARPSVRHRLAMLWAGLTQEEQVALAALGQGGGSLLPDEVLARLAAKGMCRPTDQGWQINGTLLAAYAAAAADRSRGRVWLHEPTGDVYQGQARVENLTPLERALLRFFVEQPYRRHTHQDLIEAVWPDDVVKAGVSTEALYQLIRGARKKIEPDSNQPQYIINWRGRRESGYHFFPEGRPER